MKKLLKVWTLFPLFAIFALESGNGQELTHKITVPDSLMVKMDTLAVIYITREDDLTFVKLLAKISTEEAGYFISEFFKLMLAPVEPEVILGPYIKPEKPINKTKL